MTAPAPHAARVLVQALAALGVRDVVLAPGSRSAPLAYALADAAAAHRPEHAPALRLHVRVDERVAGFLALGLARAARESGHPRPVAVVTTSGTAVANLHPAVLEAHHAGLPLLLLTADRPHELRGTGANQTTVQAGLFGAAVRLALDVPAPTGRPGEDRDLRHLAGRAVAAALGTRTADPGPVQLDLAYREPLTPDTAAWPEPGTTALAEVLSATAAVADRPVPPGPVVVVAGDGAGEQARRLAEAAGWPLLAEPSSGARSGPQAIGTYRLLLGRPELGGRIRSVVLFGRPTLSRPVSALLAREDVQLTVIAPTGADWPDAGRAADLVLPAVPPNWWQPAGDPQWTADWQHADARAVAALDTELALLDAVDELAAEAFGTASGAGLPGPVAAAAVTAATRPGDVLVLGSSNPIRDADLMARWSEPVTVLANRGLAGIDGTISTASGVALGLPGRRVRALMGDLTFLHDAGGLLHLDAEQRPDLQVVVMNDGGGSIFATLEHGAPERAAVFERIFGTAHRADLAGLCAGYRVPHRLVRTRAELTAALDQPVTGTSVVEVVVDRADRRVLMERLSAAVVAALGGQSG